MVTVLKVLWQLSSWAVTCSGVPVLVKFSVKLLILIFVGRVVIMS